MSFLCDAAEITDRAPLVLPVAAVGCRTFARGLRVTASVAVGTPRDGQDTTGHESIIELYLA